MKEFELSYSLGYKKYDAWTQILDNKILNYSKIISFYFFKKPQKQPKKLSNNSKRPKVT